MRVWASIVEQKRTITLDTGRRTHTVVDVWYRPEIRNDAGDLVWSSSILLCKNGLEARALAHEVLNSGLLAASVGA